MEIIENLFNSGSIVDTYIRDNKKKSAALIRFRNIKYFLYSRFHQLEYLTKYISQHRLTNKHNSHRQATCTLKTYIMVMFTEFLFIRITLWFVQICLIAK